MVKLNLLNAPDTGNESIPEENRHEEKAAEKPTEKKREGEESFSESIEKLIQPKKEPAGFEYETASKMEGGATAEEAEKAAPQKTAPPPKPQEPGITSEFDEDVTFEQSHNRKMLFIILGIVLVIAIAAIILFQFFMPGKEEAIPPTAKTEIAETPQPAKEETPVENKQLQEIFASNQRQNMGSFNSLRQLNALSTTNLAYSLLIIKPGQIQLTVLANSTEDLDAFRSSLKSSFPGTKIRMVNTESIAENGVSKTVADFTLDLAQGETNPPAVETRDITSKSISSILRASTKSHNLDLQKFNKGRETTDRQVRRTNYYCQISGTLSDILEFIDEMSRSYPAIYFSKITLNPRNRTISKEGNVITRITLVLSEQGVS